MRHEYLLEMSVEELDQLADMMGIDATKAKSAKAKVALIEERRSRVATVRVLGADFEVPMRLIRDKRVSDVMERGFRSDAELREVLVSILGEEQTSAVEERCTDEDGVVDVSAYALAVRQILDSEELKNF